MRNFLAWLAACIVGGLLIVPLVLVLGIELEATQLIFFVAGMVVIVSIAKGIESFIVKGGKFYEWMMQYNEHAISVQVGKAGELYVNGKLLDRNTSVWSKEVEMTGTLDSGEKLTAKITVAKAGEVAKTGRSLRCELFVDGKPLQVAPV